MCALRGALGVFEGYVRGGDGPDFDAVADNNVLLQAARDGLPVGPVHVRRNPLHPRSRDHVFADREAMQQPAQVGLALEGKGKKKKKKTGAGRPWDID